MDDRFVDIFAEVVLAADKIALLADVAAPGVFDLPAVGLSVLIKVDAGQDHGVSGVAGVRLKPCAFFHKEVGAAHDALVVEAVGIPDAVLAVAVAVGVAAEPYTHAGPQLADAEILHLLHGQIEVVDVAFRHGADVVEAECVSGNVSKGRIR